MKSKSYPFIILGAENCDRCKILHNKLPNSQMIKIPTKSLGVGDSFAKLTHLLSIKSCSSCKIRRSFLNRWFPYFWNASKEVRKARNAVLRLGHESLPVLLDCGGKKIHDIDSYVPGFTEKYMID